MIIAARQQSKRLGLVILALLLAACGPAAASPAFVAYATPTAVVAATVFANDAATLSADSQSTPPGKVTLAALDPMGVDGNLIITGSATVFPLLQALNQRFIREGFRGQVTLTSISTGDAFKTLCSGQNIDLVMASRPISADETRACITAGRYPVEFMIGQDQLSVFVNADNSFVTNVTHAQLQSLFSADRWSDVDPSWPNDSIRRYISDDQSGTFATFVQEIFKGNPTGLLAAANLTRSSSPTSLVLGVSNDPNGIGFAGHAFTLAYKSTLNLVAIDGALPGDPAAKYSLTRPLFIYADLTALRSRAQLATFINFVLRNVNKDIQTVGYLPADTAPLDESKQRLIDVTRGDLLVAGSTTVYPLASAAQKLLAQTGYSGYVVVNGVGSGAGITQFCDKHTSDIMLVSRAITQAEIDKCTSQGRTPIEFRVGTDAFTIAVNAHNMFLQNVTAADLKAIYAAEKWSDVNPQWPDRKIAHFMPDPATGGFSLVADVIYGGDQKAPLAGPNLKTTATGAETGELVSQSEDGIGILAYPFYEQYSHELRAVTLEGVPPSMDNAENGAYHLARPLNVYSDATIIRNRPQTGLYLNVLLSNLNDEAKQLGYFAPSDRIYQGNIAKLITAMQRP